VGVKWRIEAVARDSAGGVAAALVTANDAAVDLGLQFDDLAGRNIVFVHPPLALIAGRTSSA
jgi:hypothetical protein